MERKEYEMTKNQLDRILEACKPVPMIMLQCGMPRSPQENANDAWERLGEEMKFDYLTVAAAGGKGARWFTAVPKCQGIDLGDGNFSGCDKSGGDCPVCGE